MTEKIAELLEKPEMVDELSDLIITKKITPLANEVLKAKIRPLLGTKLPKHVTDEDVLSFIKRYLWYADYITEYVRLFDLLFDCPDLDYLVDIGEEIGTQMRDDGIFQSYQEEFEETINDLLETLYKDY